MSLHALHCPHCGNGDVTAHAEGKYVCAHCGGNSVPTEDSIMLIVGGTTCHKCGAIGNKGSPYCARCGNLMAKSCRRCAAASALDAIYCAACRGTEFVEGPAWVSQAMAHIRRGDLATAVKVIREVTGMGLLEAKTLAESWRTTS